MNTRRGSLSHYELSHGKRSSSLPYKLPASLPTNSTALAKDRQCQWLAGQDRAWTHFDRITLKEREGNVVELVTSIDNLSFDSLQRIYNGSIRNCATAPSSPSAELQTLHASLTTRGGRSQTSDTTCWSRSTLGGRGSTSRTPSRSSGSGSRKGKERDDGSQRSPGDGNGHSEPNSATTKDSGFKCPVWEKDRGGGKILAVCKNIFDTKEAVIQHADLYHLRCPICHYDPVKPKKRCHSTDLTKGKTLKNVYFGDLACFMDHIFIHLRYLLCQYGCSQGFFAENDRKRHESTCTLRESGVKEQPLPPELVELRRKVESLKCSRMDKSKIVRELESLLLSREGPTRMRKIFDAYDSTNRLFGFSSNDDTDARTEISSEPSGGSSSSSGNSNMTAREVDKHVARIIRAPVESRKKFLSRLVDSVMLDDRAFLAGLLKLWDKTSTSEGTSGESTAEPPAPKRTKRDHPDGGSGGLSDHHRYLPPGLEGADTRIVPPISLPQVVVTDPTEQPRPVTCDPRNIFRNIREPSLLIDGLPLIPNSEQRDYFIPPPTENPHRDLPGNSMQVCPNQYEEWQGNYQVLYPYNPENR